MKPLFGSSIARIRPATQVLEVTWRPELRVIERRVEVLRRLEDDHNMHSFRFGEHDFAARFEGTELTMSIEGAELWVGPTSKALITGLGALRTALELIGAANAQRMRAWFTHVVALQGDYSEQRTRTGRLLYPWWPADITDHALLVDGRAQLADTNFQCEFGLVSRAEIEPRVNRTVGRISGPETRALVRFDPDQLPQVALFADSSWTYVPEPVQAIANALLFDRLNSFLDAVASEANALVAGLVNAVGQAREGASPVSLSSKG